MSSGAHGAGVMQGVARMRFQPEGLCNASRGLEPDGERIRQPAAVGLKPSAIATQAADAACSQHPASHPTAPLLARYGCEADAALMHMPRCMLCPYDVIMLIAQQMLRLVTIPAAP